MQDQAPMDQLSAHLDRAWDLVARGDWAGAMRSAEEALEIDPESPEVHNLMGYVCAQDGRPEEALEHYERAIELDESFVEAMLNAAEVKLHPLHDWDGAAALVDSALEWIDNPEEQAEALLLKVDALLGKDDRGAAAAVVRTLPEGPFENAGLCLSMGRAFFEVGDARRAEIWLERALEKEPHSAEGHYYLGLALAERSEKRGAAVAFLRARDADLRDGQRAPLLPTDQFERKVQSAIRKLPVEVATVVDGALVIVGELPGAEVVAEGVDPRIPVLFDDLAADGEPPRAGRVFVYQRNVERIVHRPEEIEDEIAHAIIDEAQHVFPELVSPGGEDILA